MRAHSESIPLISASIMSKKIAEGTGEAWREMLETNVLGLLEVTRRVLPRDEAVAYFKSIGEHYKAEIIASIPANEDVSLYREGA